MKRIYKILLLVLVPLLVAVGVGIYSYHRYQNYFYGYYLQSAKYKDTEDLINRYMMYNDTHFQEYLKQDVVNEAGDDLFTIAVYREFDLAEKENEDDEDTYTMRYSFWVYNVDYENVYRTIPGYTDTKEHKFNGYVPKFKLIVTDAADEDNVIESFFDSANESINYIFKDYKFTGVGDTQRWQDGTKMQPQNVQIVALEVDEYEITENVNIKVVASDSGSVDDDSFDALVIDKTDFLTNVKKLNASANTYDGSEITAAYNGDFKAAGYVKYVITKWMWWECLIGLALTLIVTGSTVLVWQSENAKEKKLQEKIAEKKNNK